MNLIEALDANAAAVASIGRLASDEARTAGTTCSYEDPDREGVIVLLHPDGTREFVPMRDPEGSDPEAGLRP